MRVVRKVRLGVSGYPDSDHRERTQLGLRLQNELSRLAIEDVRPLTATAPAGAKGAALEWTALAVSLVGTLPSLIAFLQSWLGRHPGAAITVVIDGDSVTLTDPTSEEHRELLDAWLQRHADG